MGSTPNTGVELVPGICVLSVSLLGGMFTVVAWKGDLNPRLTMHNNTLNRVYFHPVLGPLWEVFWYWFIHVLYSITTMTSWDPK